MRKTYITLFIYAYVSFALAQNPQIKTDMPTVLPPSPTVAALMKFEEVPVSNYTGVPDISIPLVSSQTLSKDIIIDLSLKYHPASASANDVASDVGLGWSFFAGGTISRTVKGYPDEYFRPINASFEPSGKLGIYKWGTPPYHNPFYQIYENANSLFNVDAEVLNEFLWEAQEKGKYDTEHDLWQYNFMGHSGRFIIKKNSSGILEVANQALNDNLKIVNHYSSDGTYTPLYFEIFDDKGYRFVFDVVERTTSSSANQVVFFGINYDYASSTDLPIVYESAFHLSKIYDNNNNMIVEFKFNGSSEPMKEVTVDQSLTINEMMHTNPRDFMEILMIQGDGDMQHQNRKLLPREIVSWNTRTVLTKKVKEINIVGHSNIFINYEDGRQDTDYNASNYRTKEIILKDWAGTSLKKFTFTHAYSEILKKRMILTGITQSNFTDSVTEERHFYYESNPTNNQFVYKDYWGYFNLRPFLGDGGTFRETTPSFCTSDLLQKMTLPSGGSVIFDFEPNKYSYVGDTALNNFDDNPENWNQVANDTTFTTISNNKVSLFTIAAAQTVAFQTTTDFGSLPDTIDWRFKLYKVNGATDTFVANLDNMNCGEEECIFYQLLTPGQYKVEFSSVDMDLLPPAVFTANIKAYYKVDSGANKQYLFGGGNRIRRIGYFDDSSVPQTFYKDYNYNILFNTPKKEMSFDYAVFGNALKSSGSLVFAKPKFEYQQSKLHHFVFICRGLGELSQPYVCLNYVMDFSYRTYTDINNLQNIRTHGADVGYQNVKVYETDNGKTEFTYSSPIDVPESDEAYNTGFPFYPSENFDYKRGLLKNQKIYDKNNKPLEEIIFDHDIIEVPQDSTLIGFRTQFINYNCPYSYAYPFYNHGFPENNYKGCLDFCAANPGYNPSLLLLCGWDCDLPYYYIGYRQIFEANGWAKLKRKTTKKHFYPNGGTTAKIVTTEENYQYNPVNKEISQSTVTNSKGEVMKTEYFYHTGNSTTNQNRISEIERIETSRGSTLLSTSKIEYANNFPGNASYLPSKIQAAKAAQSLEDRVKYNKYDEFGNPLELQQEGGTIVCYIWGYNKTQPVAKIENISYAAIPSGLITNIQSASDTPNNEANLLTALAALRNHSSMSGAMVTTYTYIPLIGVSTITDPKGDKTTYSYDAFGRLKEVKDDDGNILSQNQYHYRTQN